MLVGQAKKDFEKWYFNRSKYKRIIEIISFGKLPESMQYGVIVDWFDSVGIMLNVGRV